MAVKVVAMSALLVAFATASGMPSAPEATLQDAELDAALGSDDTCGATGEEAAVCALNALQVKADMVGEKSDSESQGACDTGLVGQIKKLAPGCLSACPVACKP